jgi:DNA-binding NarL/FixJ family response regulator
MQASIIIADDHPLILKGLKDFLIEKKYNVIESATNGRDAYSIIKSHNPDIAILDINMPYLTGLEIAEKCLVEGITSKIIFITFEKDEKLYNKAKELNIFGYVLKEFALNEIETCIESVINEIPYFSPDLLKYLDLDEAPKQILLLTETEKKVLNFIAKNYTAKEIGELMFISKRTVEKHKSNIVGKLKLDAKVNTLLLYAKKNESLF